MKGQIVDLMECLVTKSTSVAFFIAMRQTMVFIVAFLVKALATEFTNERFVTSVDSLVSVQSR